MLKYLASAATAAGDTTKTLIATIQLPAGSKALLGVWVYANGGPGETTLENRTGILELESPDVNLQPCQVPLEQTTMLTGGANSVATKVWPLSVGVKGGERISGYLTMDMAITVENLARFGLVVEV